MQAMSGSVARSCENGSEQQHALIPDVSGFLFIHNYSDRIAMPRSNRGRTNPSIGLSLPKLASGGQASIETKDRLPLDLAMLNSLPLQCNQRYGV
jgi:hypothetical protein